jgi:hypothetical protein
VAGRLVDAETGEGIGGAEIFRTYDSRDRLAVMGEPSGTGIDGGWTTTDAEGRFEFKSEWRRIVGGVALNAVDSMPWILWIHRDYGWGSPEIGTKDPDHVEIKVNRDEREIRHLQDWRLPPVIGSPCSGFGSREAKLRCRLVAYGSNAPGVGPPW